MKRERQCLLLALLVCCVNLSFAADRIIFRDGHIEEVILDQISDVLLRYRPTQNKSLQQSVPTKDVYMYYTKAYGNTYVTSEGKRFSGEKKCVDKNLDVIYLVSGKEIGTSSITRFPDGIAYVEKSQGKKKGPERTINLDNDQVFMICYKNGMTELVTELIKPDNDKAEVTANSEIESDEDGDTGTQFSVVFHEVKKGDTLAKLASFYSVTEEELRKWNDIAPTVKSNTQLQIGANLMIYLPKSDD